MEAVDLSKVLRAQKKALEDERRRHSNRLADRLYQIRKQKPAWQR